MVRPVPALLSVVVLGVLTLSLAPTANAMEHERSDVSVGFSSGWATHDQTPLSPAEGSLASGAGLLEPFSAAPYSGVEQSSFEGEIVWVFDHVRLSLARRSPVASFAMADTVVTLADGTEAFTRGLEVREWQVGIGAELPVKDAPVVPYLELAGVRRRVQAEVAIPEGMVSYSGRSFTFVAKGGVMVPLGEHVFLDVYGQTALRGQPGWNAGLSLGVAMF